MSAPAVASPPAPGVKEALDDELLRRETPGSHRARRQGSRCSDGGRLTLEQRISSVWEGLHAAGAAECPVCRGRMERAGSAAVCRSCRSRIE